MQTLPINYKIEKIKIEALLNFFKKDTIRGYCKSCPNYNKIWSCPDYNFSEEEYIKKFKFAYIIGAKVNYNEIQCDIEKLRAEGKENVDISTYIYYSLRKIVDKKIFSLENEFKNSTCLLGGKCTLCKTCAKENSSPCRHPDKLRYSLESLGFEVSSIIENVLRDKLLFTGNSLPPYCLSVYALFSKDEIDIKEINNILLSME